MTGVYSTVVNYSNLDLLRRFSRIQTINEIVTDIGDSFTFPKENISSKLGTGKDNDCKKLPTINEIKEVVLKAKSDALTNCLAVGLNTTDEALCTIHIKPDIDDCVYQEVDDKGKFSSESDSDSPNKTQLKTTIPKPTSPIL
ncbi:hypothetical protein RN001_009639 [Aquatica leii]|uniref:Uncharacterized protein n=1 Tax=Aquatica leii TaxID=1421715 RepID=A0AAN7P6X2_9COLE|nr:hypothetical protein RN001_009639 [Aquatica leii]